MNTYKEERLAKKPTNGLTKMPGLHELSFSHVTANAKFSRRVNDSIARKSGISFPQFAPRSHSPLPMSGDFKRQIEVSGWIEVEGRFISGLACKEPQTL